MVEAPPSPGGTVPSIDEHLDAAGFGWFQMRIFCIMSMLVVADGMEMTVLSMLREPLKREFGLDDYGFAALGSGASQVQFAPPARLRFLRLCSSDSGVTVGAQ